MLHSGTEGNEYPKLIPIRSDIINRMSSIKVSCDLNINTLVSGRTQSWLVNRPKQTQSLRLMKELYKNMSRTKLWKSINHGLDKKISHRVTLNPLLKNGQNVVQPRLKEAVSQKSVTL